VLSWNLHGAARPPIARVAHVLERAAPDGVALQEIRRRQARQLAKRLGWHHEWTFKHNAYWPLWWRAEGLSILAPSALDDVWRTCLSVGVSRRSFRRRVAMAATVRRADGGALRLFDTHLATGDPQARLAQALRLTARIHEEAFHPVVLAGDLNARDEVELIRTFAPVGLVDPGGADTSPAVAPVQRIDYILVPTEATIVDRRTPDGGPHWAALSDHLPTLVEIRSSPSSGAAPSR
jgi:endonuclease/exonuclease/phosphatase family metal-dependent hydrolase